MGAHGPRPWGWAVARGHIPPIRMFDRGTGRHHPAGRHQVIYRPTPTESSLTGHPAAKSEGPREWPAPLIQQLAHKSHDHSTPASPQDSRQRPCDRPRPVFTQSTCVEQQAFQKNYIIEDYHARINPSGYWRGVQPPRHLPIRAGASKNAAQLAPPRSERRRLRVMRDALTKQDGKARRASMTIR